MPLRVIVQVPLPLVVQLFGVPPMFQVPLISVLAGPPETVTMADQVGPWRVAEPMNVIPLLTVTVTVTLACAVPPTPVQLSV
jgi:hypothetical protein